MANIEQMGRTKKRLVEAFGDNYSSLIDPMAILLTEAGYDTFVDPTENDKVLGLPVLKEDDAHEHLLGKMHLKTDDNAPVRALYANDYTNGTIVTISQNDNKETEVFVDMTSKEGKIIIHSRLDGTKSLSQLDSTFYSSRISEPVVATMRGKDLEAVSFGKLLDQKAQVKLLETFGTQKSK